MSNNIYLRDKSSDLYENHCKINNLLILSLYGYLHLPHPHPSLWPPLCICRHVYRWWNICDFDWAPSRPWDSTTHCQLYLSRRQYWVKYLRNSLFYTIWKLRETVYRTHVSRYVCRWSCGEFSSSEYSSRTHI